MYALKTCHDGLVLGEMGSDVLPSFPPLSRGEGAGALKNFCHETGRRNRSAERVILSSAAQGVREICLGSSCLFSSMCFSADVFRVHMFVSSKHDSAPYASSVERW